MITTHIWTCADQPSSFVKIMVDDQKRFAGVVEFTDKKAKEHLGGDHEHIFLEIRMSPKGRTVFHECPGKALAIGDHIVLGEE